MPAGVPTFEKFDEARREVYFEALRRGVPRTIASREAGVSHYLVCMYRQQNPEFAHEETASELESHDRIENALYNTALNGNVTAQQVWLYNRRSDRWSDKRVASQNIHINQSVETHERGEVSADQIIDAVLSTLVALANPAGDGEGQNGSGTPLALPVRGDAESRSVAG